MLLRFPFPETGDEGNVSNMDVSVRRHLTSVVDKRKAREPVCSYKGVASRLALVSIVFLVHVWSPGAAAARTFGDEFGSDAVVAYESGSVSPGLEFGAHFLGMLLMTLTVFCCALSRLLLLLSALRRDFHEILSKFSCRRICYMVVDFD